ncbi:MAG: hypothetical protein CMM76_13930 [Rhodospirillaceae bacterium]|nr:hypothetical protein [Rhodospirillaceae bacterium]
MRFALCTSIYEAGRPFLADWIEAAITAAERHEVCAHLAIDDFVDAEGACGLLINAMSVTFVKAPEKSTTATVRETMINGAANGNADAIVFCDMDDRLRPNALTNHSEALNGVDFSYGDLQPIDAAGSLIGDTFFSNIVIPNRTQKSCQIADRNWLGFSNTAVIRDKLPSSVFTIPATVIAVDWWFYTQLLQNGLTGSRTNAVVAEYRVHADNQLGPYASTDIQEIKRRSEIVRCHYQALAPDPTACKMITNLENLISELETNPDAVKACIRQIQMQPMLWHEDICFLAAQSSEENNHSKK